MRNATIFILIMLVLFGCMTNKIVLERVDKKESTAKKDEVGKTSKFVVYDEEPIAIKRAPLNYPTFALNARIEGEVILEVEVFADGTVGAVEVVKSLMSGPGGLDISAVNSVKQWKSSPAKRKGKPVACWLTFPIKFTLK